MLRAVYKYLFAFVVAAYMITVVGIPVYFHYCGGELEKIDYVTKSNGCCDGDEDQEEENGCCSDEGKLLLNNPDFTIKDNNGFHAKNTVAQINFITSPVRICINPPTRVSLTHFNYQPPPLSLRVVAITVLRI